MTVEQYKPIDDKAATNWAMAARQANREFMKVMV
jgi:hypothetical protein